MDPVFSMFLTCSHPFPEALAPSGMKIDERMENRIEADFTTLKVENMGLRELVQQNGWTIHGLLGHMEVMEARMALLSAQVSAVTLPQSVDLTREESEGGVGGPLVLGLPIWLRSPSLLRLEEVVNLETLRRSWDFVGREATTEGDYTPTGPCYQSPEL